MLSLVGFEETYSGCWVKKIFVNGNAANTSRGDKLEVGDHLASVNGTNVYKKNITEVCKVLANTADSDELQLTFIRYVGPIRNSNANEQQGYEVIDPHVKNSSSKSSPVKLPKALSNSVGGNQSLHDGHKAHSNDQLEEQAVQTNSANKKEDSMVNESTPVDLKKENIPAATKVQPKHETKKKKRGFNLFRRRKDNGLSNKDKKNTK